MKKLMTLLLVVCFLLAGCGSSAENAETEATPATTTAVTTTEATTAATTTEATTTEATTTAATTETTTEATTTEQAVPTTTIYPLPDSTMEDTDNAILSISLIEGDAYLDADGALQMNVTIYSYDQYEMMDIAQMQVGDVIMTRDGEVEIVSLERVSDDTIAINGGSSNDGFELVTEDQGLFYECGPNGSKNWHAVGEVTLRVSTEFVYHDCSSPLGDEVVYYAGNFLNGEVTDFDFTPHNTTIRVEDGQVVEMYRAYRP